MSDDVKTPGSRAAGPTASSHQATSERPQLTVDGLRPFWLFPSAASTGRPRVLPDNISMGVSEFWFILFLLVLASFPRRHPHNARTQSLAAARDNIPFPSPGRTGSG